MHPEVCPELCPEVCPEVYPDVNPVVCPEVCSEVFPEVCLELCTELCPELCPEVYPDVCTVVWSDGLHFIYLDFLKLLIICKTVFTSNDMSRNNGSFLTFCQALKYSLWQFCKCSV